MMANPNGSPIHRSSAPEREPSVALIASVPRVDQVAPSDLFAAADLHASLQTGSAPASAPDSRGHLTLSVWWQMGRGRRQGPFWAIAPVCNVE
jgi:hypothetical protein